ncbi:MAG: NAD(P)/FAD-dependent oxidoreductase [Actinomycetota bacterium]|nr:NAD(P)/FAD-dependent oxidoreductase [Actinomycetota bacterium]
MPEAVVIGAGPNGLVGANLLADAGWDVVVLEAQPEPGGAVRSSELTLPGYVNDRFSAFYPLGVGSPVMRRLKLEEHGLRWRRHPVTVAHPATDGSVALLSADLDETCASLDTFAAGDGDEWRKLYAWWQRVGPAFLSALLDPFPPVRAGARLYRALGGMEETLEFARFALLPVRRFADEHFRGAGGGRLLAGNALHADVSPEIPGGALFGMVLVGTGQALGFPIPEGGAGSLTAALVRRLESRGGRVECNAEVAEIIVRRGRAVGVRTADGREIDARQAVLADVGAPQLYLKLLSRELVPSRILAGMERFQYDNGTVKLDWALDGPIPWSNPDVGRAGTVHVTEGIDALSIQGVHMSTGQIPADPFLVLGQYALADPTRQPPGCETAWAYTHIPQVVHSDAGPDNLTGRWDERERELFADRMEAQIEKLAPGFRDRVRARHVMAPEDLEASDANLVNGALNGGTAQLHQQLVFRPVPGLGRSETPVENLYLASASAHPGGGVHGAPGANAARAALKQRGPGARLAARVARISGDGATQP